MNPNWHNLTTDEQKGLELRFNGPIPEQAVIDTIRTRPVRTVATVEAAIEQKLRTISQLKSWLHEDIQSDAGEWRVGTSRNAVVSAERELDGLYRELETLSVRAAE
jgi:hypothetical protein